MRERNIDEFLWQLAGEDVRSSSPRFVKKLGWEPRVDVLENDEAIIVVAELAGVTADRVELVYRGETSVLVMRGVRNPPQLPRCRAQHLEIPYGEFQREVVLPNCPLDTENVQASVRDGLLTLILPKAEPVRPRPTHTVIVIRV